MKTQLSRTKKLKCRNANPETSKYWKWAPHGGCNEIVEVDEKVDAVLCHRCTMRSVKG